MLALLGAGGSALLGGSLGRTPVRYGALRMQGLPTGGSDLEANNEQGNTFWATLDGRDKDGISSDGMVPPGDDLIEEDLKRVFSIDPDEEGLAGDSGFSDMDEMQLMYKLRKELGENDFNRIFDNVKVKGVDIDY